MALSCLMEGQSQIASPPPLALWPWWSLHELAPFHKKSTAYHSALLEMLAFRGKK